MGRARMGRTSAAGAEVVHRSKRSGRSVGACIRVSLLFALALIAAPWAFPKAAQAESNVVGFGANGQGQLGAGYQDGEEIAPVSVPGLTSVVQIAQGFNFTLALTSSGTVESWGENNYGQLGVGSPHYPQRCRSPQVIPGLSEVVAVAAAGNHAMALLQDGEVRTWGVTQGGEFGNGTQGTSVGEEEEGEEGETVELPEEEEEAAHEVIVEEHGCEYRPEHHEKHPDTGTSSDELQTPAMPKETVVTAIAAGGQSDYALVSTGQVEAWGSNTDGQLGNKMPTTAEREKCEAKFKKAGEKPKKHSGETKEAFEERLAKWKQEEKERREANLAYFEENHSECQLLCYTEQGIKPCLTTPHVVEAVPTESELGKGSYPMNNVVSIAPGGEQFYALIKSGSASHVEALGNNASGQLGNGVEKGGENNPVAVEVVGSSGYTKIGAGNKEGFGVSSSGSAYGWGDATDGELIGAGETKFCAAGKCYRTPHLLTGSGGLPSGTVEDMEGGGDDSFIVIGHKLYAFGENENGNLGINSKTIKKTSTATLIEGIGEVKEASAAELRTSVLLVKNTAPAPLVELVPSVGGLTLNWTINATKYKVRESPLSTLDGAGHEYTKLAEPLEKVHTFSWPNATEPALLRADTAYRATIQEVKGSVNETRVIFGTPLARAGFPVTGSVDTFERAPENPLSDGGKWSVLGWTKTAGAIYSRADGWMPTEGTSEAPESEASGAYWNAHEFVGPAVAVHIYAENKRNYVALWCDTTGTGAKNGYRVMAVGTGSGYGFRLVLQKWVEGSATTLGESSEIAFKGLSQENVVGMTASGGTVKAWYGTTEETMAVKVEAADATFSRGYTGIEGTGLRAFGETDFGGA